ncbi:hypothetical protein [Agrococcus sp. ARC_14]|uniref:hypothetical protein n=1 Tax=Agrococcus sp. ARC_14 TaxID=2919927 RepID=UPI001F05DA39|nr:hypothetical protein [Agrococcus sp. ARC_14]MCH1883947.1 hypothetical protein [Agrococcus sp. ARC_14]
MPDRADGSFVTQSDALRVWWPAARDALLEVARDYGAWLTHEQLSERIQAATGISTRHPAPEWIGRVLDRVSNDAESRGEPHLTSLCVGADLAIGADYPWAPAGGGERAREQGAAEDRFECYRFFGATLPADGGAPQLTPRALAPAKRSRSSAPRGPRATPRATPPPAIREVLCTECFMLVPVAAQCRDCGAPLPEPTEG